MTRENHHRSICHLLLCICRPTSEKAQKCLIFSKKNNILSKWKTTNQKIPNFNKILWKCSWISPRLPSFLLNQWLDTVRPSSLSAIIKEDANNKLQSSNCYLLWSSLNPRRKFQTKQKKFQQWYLMINQTNTQMLCLTTS